jgi:hypothetical protein
MIPELGCYTCLPVFYEKTKMIIREVNRYSVIMLLGEHFVYMKMYCTVITKQATLYIFAAGVNF